MQGKSCIAARELYVYVQKNASTQVDPAKESDPEKFTALYPSSSYQKVLDYHVAEILLSTIVLAVIAMLRFHR